VVAVCLHDVEHETLDRCRRIRRWLLERGIHRITLLAIPDGRAGPLIAGDDCVEWLQHRTSLGDTVAQHGMHHQRSAPAGRARGWVADRQGGDAAEFVGLSAEQSEQAVTGGLAVLREAGLRPRGFVAPAYAYTSGLRRAVCRRFDWYGGLLAIHGPRTLPAPAFGLGTSTHFKRHTSPAVLRAGAVLPGRVLRLDIHPADFDLPRHVQALDAVLRISRARRPVTYDELARR
jgi:predicted deacetylase